jgi:hypothetical protein
MFAVDEATIEAIRRALNEGRQAVGRGCLRWGLTRIS